MGVSVMQAGWFWLLVPEWRDGSLYAVTVQFWCERGDTVVHGAKPYASVYG
jgi:hypothetical protein